MRRLFLVGVGLACLAVTLRGAPEEGVYRLNGKIYSIDVAPPYQPLPTSKPTPLPGEPTYVLKEDEKEVLRVPDAEDVLEYHVDGQSITGRVVNTDRMLFSNGLEIGIDSQSVQRVFQILAETHIMMNTPQQLPDSMRPNMKLDPSAEIIETMNKVPFESVIIEKPSTRTNRF